jgi:tripartite ATP-independent transporter DctM subunit
MSVGLVSLVVLAIFFGLLVLGLPVAFCLISTTVISTLLFWSPTALYVAATTIYTQATQEIFLAIPFFVFLASMLEKSGIAESLYDMFYKWLGRLRGGLGVSTVLMCTIMDAISGLGASGIVTIGPIAVPEMTKRKYHNQIALGCIAAGSALGPLIPPSVIMIIIAGFTGLSVGRLFAGGLFPGLLCSLLFCLYILIASALKPEMAPAITQERRVAWGEKLVSLRAVVLPVFLIGLVMGSIYTGICTPTEGAAVGAFGALICAGVNRKLTVKTIYASGKMSIRVTCMVMWLLIAGSMFAALLNALQIQAMLARTLASIQADFGTFGLVATMMVIVFIMGMFIDGAAITVLTMPLFYPVIEKAGVDTLWFGILFTVNIVTGYLTPPFGMNLFYLKGVVPEHVKMIDIYRSIIPYIALMLVALCVVAAFPGLATWFPNAVIVSK